MTTDTKRFEAVRCQLGTWTRWTNDSSWPSAIRETTCLLDDIAPHYASIPWTRRRISFRGLSDIFRGYILSPRLPLPPFLNLINEGGVVCWVSHELERLLMVAYKSVSSIGYFYSLPSSVEFEYYAEGMVIFYFWWNFTYRSLRSCIRDDNKEEEVGLFIDTYSSILLFFFSRGNIYRNWSLIRILFVGYFWMIL